MDPTGIRRKVDDLGRIVIPAPMRRALDIAEGDALEVTVSGDRLIMRKVAERCAFCSSARELSEFRGTAVCWSCMAAIRALDRERTAAPHHPFGR
jgi:transcriptional pleiotropic regulator of transition state genes